MPDVSLNSFLLCSLVDGSIPILPVGQTQLVDIVLNRLKTVHKLLVLHWYMNKCADLARPFNLVPPLCVVATSAGRPNKIPAGILWFMTCGWWPHYCLECRKNEPTCLHKQKVIETSQAAKAYTENSSSPWSKSFQLPISRVEPWIFLMQVILALMLCHWAIGPFRFIIYRYCQQPPRSWLHLRK